MPDDLPAWAPDPEDSGPPSCDRCGATVSMDFHRVWAVDGVLDGCRECLPRSVRFSRTNEPTDQQEDFDLERHNRGKDPGGIEPEK